MALIFSVTLVIECRIQPRSVVFQLVDPPGRVNRALNGFASVVSHCRLGHQMLGAYRSYQEDDDCMAFALQVDELGALTT